MLSAVIQGDECMEILLKCFPVCTSEGPLFQSNIGLPDENRRERERERWYGNGDHKVARGSRLEKLEEIQWSTAR